MVTDAMMADILKNYGFWAFVGFYVFKSVWEMLGGKTKGYIDAINLNTEAVKKLSHDMRVAFTNIKEIRDKNQMGPITKPDELEN